MNEKDGGKQGKRGRYRKREREREREREKERQAGVYNKCINITEKHSTGMYRRREKMKGRGEGLSTCTHCIDIMD